MEDEQYKKFKAILLLVAGLLIISTLLFFGEVIDKWIISGSAGIVISFGISELIFD